MFSRFLNSVKCLWKQGFTMNGVIKNIFHLALVKISELINWYNAVGNMHVLMLFTRTINYTQATCNNNFQNYIQVGKSNDLLLLIKIKNTVIPGMYLYKESVYMYVVEWYFNYYAYVYV